MSKTYTPESILAALEAGKTSYELADEFTNALNSALDLQEKKEKEKAAAAEARRKADEARAKERAAADAERKLQIADAEELLEHIRNYLEVYYPNAKIEDNMTGEKFIEFVDGLVNVEKVLKDMPKFDKLFDNFNWLDKWPF